MRVLTSFWKKNKFYITGQSSSRPICLSLLFIWDYWIQGNAVRNNRGVQNHNRMNNDTMDLTSKKHVADREVCEQKVCESCFFIYLTRPWTWRFYLCQDMLHNWPTKKAWCKTMLAHKIYNQQILCQQNQTTCLLTDLKPSTCLQPEQHAFHRIRIGTNARRFACYRTDLNVFETPSIR